jgi:anti-sigma regulatory factor (Ser/Thr protein kinase)
MKSEDPSSGRPIPPDIRTGRTTPAPARTTGGADTAGTADSHLAQITRCLFEAAEGRGPERGGESGGAAHEFAMRFTSTPRGARLARRLAACRLDEWGHPYGTDTHDTVVLVVAELAANAVRHGHVPGRDFHLRLTATPVTIRIEVSDTLAERRPCPAPPPPSTAPTAESGRGLLLVSQLATRWGVMARTAAPGKTVWAEVRGEGSPRAEQRSP